MSISWHKKFILTAEDIKKANTPSNVIEIIKSLLQNNTASSELSVILTELYNNSVDHGLLNLESAIKQEPNGLEKYYNLRKERLENLSQGTVVLDCYFKAEKKLFIIEVSDSGHGFDYQTFITSPMVYEKQSGKGLYIINKIARDVSYNSSNNTLRIEYKIPAEETIVTEVTYESKFNATDALK